MKKFYDEGKYIVRLHTGDPCIFGAIQEQMAFFDANHMEYHITPGISSFLAAAAELQSQFTIPERCQTIILTRGEGRTPMPEKEQLHLLAKSQSTMCIFLSAAIVDDVQRELLQEYPEDTPVAACYHMARSEDLSRQAQRPGKDCPRQQANPHYDARRGRSHRQPTRPLRTLLQALHSSLPPRRRRKRLITALEREQRTVSIFEGEVAYHNKTTCFTFKETIF